MSYQAFILLPSDSDVSIEDVRQALENYYVDDPRDIAFDTADNSLDVAIEDWDLYVTVNSSPHVVEESEEMAEMFANQRPDKDEIAACGKRLEISSEEDEDMDYFNDYIEIIEQLGKFKGAKIWEGAQQEFID